MLNHVELRANAAAPLSTTPATTNHQGHTTKNHRPESNRRTSPHLSAGVAVQPAPAGEVLTVVEQDPIIVLTQP
jgi:hypothetical protein